MRSLDTKNVQQGAGFISARVSNAAAGYPYPADCSSRSQGSAAALGAASLARWRDLVEEHRVRRRQSGCDGHSVSTPNGAKRSILAGRIDGKHRAAEIVRAGIRIHSDGVAQR